MTGAMPDLRMSPPKHVLLVVLDGVGEACEFAGNEPDKPAYDRFLRYGAIDQDPQIAIRVADADRKGIFVRPDQHAAWRTEEMADDPKDELERVLRSVLARQGEGT